jgi:hypothetical protein
LLPPPVGSIVWPNPDAFFRKLDRMILKSSRCRFSLMLLVVTLVATSHVRAQVDKQEKADAETAQRQELQKKTLSLLDEVISAAWSLKLPENRSFVLANAADLLWPYDEKRARNLFWETLNNLNLSVYQPANQLAKERNSSASTNGPTKEQQQEVNRYYAAIQPRQQFLRRVASHDPQLALDMMRATRQGPAPQLASAPRYDPDTDLEQDLSSAAAASDPKRALQVARETLAKGLNYQILNLLRQVNQKDQDTGTALAGDIIAKLKTDNFSASSFAPFVVANLLQTSRTSGAVLIGSSSLDSASFTRLKLDDNQKQDLVDMLVTAALDVRAGPNVLQTIRGVMPEIEQYAPDRVAQLKTRLTESNTTLPQYLRDWDAFEARFEKATPEEMLKAVSKVSDDQRDALLHLAASKAVARGEADRFRELVNNQIENEAQRKTALEMLDSEQMYYDMREGETDDLEKLLPLIRAKEQRATAMAQLAMMLQQRGQHDEALKLLDDARALVKLDLVNQAQGDALLAVMLAYTQVDPPKAFAMIEPLVDRTNEEISKLLLVDKIVKSGFVKNGEIVLNQPQVPLDYSMLRYSAGVVALGKADFDRTKALADRFQRSELKLVGRMLLAQALLRHLQTIPPPQTVSK